MKVIQNLKKNDRWDRGLPVELDGPNTACFVFYGPDADAKAIAAELTAAMPRSHIIGCSGAGEIAQQDCSMPASF